MISIIAGSLILVLLLAILYLVIAADIGFREAALVFCAVFALTAIVAGAALLIAHGAGAL